MSVQKLQNFFGMFEFRYANGGWTEGQELFLAGCNQEPGFQE